jgi:predicted ABC-type ATPase
MLSNKWHVHSTAIQSQLRASIQDSIVMCVTSQHEAAFCLACFHCTADSVEMYINNQSRLSISSSLSSCCAPHGLSAAQDQGFR